MPDYSYCSLNSITCKAVIRYKLSNCDEYLCKWGKVIISSASIKYLYLIDDNSDVVGTQLLIECK